MSTAQTIAALTSFERRGAGTNAERRAAVSLASELRARRRDATIETFWCRPNWALAHAWHVALAVAGSLVSVHTPVVGGALILIALASLVLDELTGVSLGRRLSREHASQNVVSHAPGDGPPSRLIITANYDAGRMGLVYRPALRRLASRLSESVDGRAPGWLGWLAIAFACLLVTAIIRDRGGDGVTLGAVQLIPTAALVLTLAALLELAGSRFSPGAGDNASGVALALAIAGALDVAPPKRLAVDVVLQGAGDGAMTGLRRYFKAHRRELRATNTLVLGIGPCSGGTPRWWTSDGPLIPLRFLPRLAQIAARVAGPGTELGAAPHRGRGVSPAYPARLAGHPALGLGCLDKDGLVPRSHLPTDLPEASDRRSLDTLLKLALTLIDAIDADLGAPASDPAAASPTTA